MDEERRYSISEVSERTGVADYTLRQWERKVRALRPRRTRTNRRYYTVADIEIVIRLKQLLEHEGHTLKGAEGVLEEEIRGEGRPKSNAEILALLDRLESEARAMLEILDQDLLQ